MPRPPISAAAAYLLSAAAIRERCALVLAAAERGETRHFRLDPAGLDAAMDRVVAVTRRRYPDLAVPYHSRWRHFDIGGIDRAALVAPGRQGPDAARARIDLAIVSVLLDAGAGPEWHYREAETGQTFSRSEGLAVASLRAMQSGLFSDEPGDPWRADAAALAALTPARLGEAFQVERGNALAGLDGRTGLLQRLGETILATPADFAHTARPGGLFDVWAAHRPELPLATVLATLLRTLGPIWPGRLTLDGVSLGDCGRHPAIPGNGLVPFHKLSQWLAYSMIEPLEAAGLAVTALDGLTGLAEYRNGGLLIDAGALVPCDPALAATPLDPAGELVIEWRALTVALMDRLAEGVRDRLGLDSRSFPLARLLEGGSWAAGREIAREKRGDGGPPLTIASDGTWF